MNKNVSNSMYMDAHNASINEKVFMLKVRHISLCTKWVGRISSSKEALSAVNDMNFLLIAKDFLVS